MAQAAIDKIELTKRLVAFDTTSRNSNLALIDFVRDYLDGHGVASELVFSADRGKANLYATIGPQDRGGILLSGHTDVVPVDDQDWHSDPFKPLEKDERIYGRGTCDMKAFVATVLSLVPTLLARRLKTPIHLSFSYDEEVGCLGVRRLIDVLADRPNRPRLCIIGEPTGMQVGVGHKGKHTLRCQVHGHEAHSSQVHLGVNAIEAAGELIAKLREIARRKRDKGPFDEDFAPSYSTIHIGVIHGGTALNIVPRECSFDFEFRNIPADDADLLLAEVKRYAETVLLPEMHSVSRATGIAFDERNAVTGLDIAPDHPLVQLMRSLTGANAVGKVSFCAEAGLYQDAEIPTVICGPGSIDVAHKANEYVALDQIRQCESFMRRLMDHLAH